MRDLFKMSYTHIFNDDDVANELMTVTASSFSKDMENLDGYNAFYNPEDWYKN